MTTGKAEIEIKICPGQFIYGRNSAAKELNMKPSTVRNRMEKLKKMQNVDIKEDNQFSIISIINWECYQQTEIIKDSKEDHGRTTKGQSKDTNKKVKKVYNKETLSPELCKFTEDFIRYVVSEKANKAPKETPALLKTSLDAVDKLMRLDGFNLDYIRSVTRWAVKDDFYSANFFSLAPLRNKSKNGATKFSNMAAKYDKEHGVEYHGEETAEQIKKRFGTGV